MMLSLPKVMKGWKQSCKWPKINTHEIGAVTRRYSEGTVADLCNSSESWPDDIASRQTEWLIDQLFPDALLLDCGKSLDTICTRSRENWRGHLATQQSILTVPCLKVSGFDDYEFNTLALPIILI